LSEDGEEKVKKEDGEDLVQSTCIQNLTIIVSAVPEISLAASELNVCHVTALASAASEISLMPNKI